MSGFLDLDTNDLVNSLDDDLGIDTDGDLFLKMGNDTALDINTGELHITSSFDKND